MANRRVEAYRRNGLSKNSFAPHNFLDDQNMLPKIKELQDEFLEELKKTLGSTSSKPKHTIEERGYQ